MTRKQHHRRRPTLETLEGRRLLTVRYNPVNDVLTLTGTVGNDTYSVTQVVVGTSTAVRVQEGTAVFMFPTATKPIASISAALQDGNDNLTVAPNVVIPLTADGGTGNDVIYGGGGVNTLTGGDNNDTLQGGPLGDTLRGGNDSDLLLGLDGDDFLYGDDAISTRAGSDIVYGGYGKDTIYGYLDNDWLYGEANEDTIYGGEDSDDHIEGGDADDVLFGQGGNDTILGDDGNDTIDGGDNNDTIDGGTGDDTIEGGQGVDTIDGGDDNDTIDGGTEKDTIQGGTGDDTIKGGTGNDTLFGDGLVTLPSDGNDVLFGGPGNDSLSGQGGNDRLFGEGDDDDLFGNNGDDHLFAGGGDDYLEGGAGDDILVSIDNDDTDILKGNGGLDSFWVDKQTSGLSSTTDTVNDADTNEAGYSLHEVEAFENGADKGLNGDDIAEPIGGTQWKNFSDQPLFAAAGPSVTDIRQGDLADCWLMSSLGAEANASPNAVRQLVADLGDGTYVVQLNQKQYRVDADLAVDGGDSPEHAGLGNEGSLWVALVEKVFAIQRGNDYANLNNDTPYFALGKIGGEDRHWPLFPNLSNVIPDATAPGIGGVFCTDNDDADVSVLTSGHCYSIVGATYDSAGEPVTVTLYNPYGHDDAKYAYDLQLIDWGDGSDVPYSGHNLIVAGLDNDGLLQIEIFDYAGDKTDTFETMDSSGALHLVSLDHTGYLSDVLESSLSAAQAGAITALKQQLPGWLSPNAVTGDVKDQVLGELTTITDKPANFYGDGWDDGFVTITIGDLKHDAQHPVSVIYADFSQYNWA